MVANNRCVAVGDNVMLWVSGYCGNIEVDTKTDSGGTGNTDPES